MLKTKETIRLENQLRHALKRIAFEKAPDGIDEAEWLRAIARDAVRKTKRPEIVPGYFLADE